MDMLGHWFSDLIKFITHDFFVSIFEIFEFFSNELDS